jgi:hypothetical protein
VTHKERWEHYRDTRKGTYEFRSRTRYAAVRLTAHLAWLALG